MAFPSGTATAQLISVLHRQPPPDTTLRHRRGYSPLTNEEYQAIPSTGPEGSRIDHPESDVEDTRIVDDHKREEVQQEGWSMLGWSFAASAALTVSFPSSPWSF